MARKIVKDSKKVKELSDKKLEDLKYNARGILANVRREMLNQYPFFGAVAMSLDLVPVRDIRNPTACTSEDKTESVTILPSYTALLKINKENFK